MLLTAIDTGWPHGRQRENTLTKTPYADLHNHTIASDGDLSPEALILKICMNAAYDNLRKSKHHLKNLSLETTPQVSIPSTEDASEKLAGKKTEAEVISAIGQLPRSQALSVVMRVIQGHSYREISETLGCSETTARIHVSRARSKLSQWLKHLLPTLEPEAEE